MASKKQLAECALANTPDGVRVIRIRKSLTGCAYTNPKSPNYGLLEAPRPVTRRALHVFLHECAHFALHHEKGRTPHYLEEMEAEQWATAKMREAGIAVPRKALESAKWHVTHAVEEALKRGAKRIDKRAKAYAYKMVTFRCARCGRTWTVKPPENQAVIAVCVCGRQMDEG